jgi:hypothetical protein
MDAEAVPVTGFVLNVSPMLRIAPPPCGKFSAGGFIAAKVARGPSCTGLATDG